MIRRIQLTMLMMLIGVWAMASYKSVKNADGVVIWYDFFNSTKEARVTYRGNYSSSYSNEYTGEVVIPSTVTYEGVEYSVTEIGEDAFSNCSGLTCVTIPESVTSIGAYAFYGCSGLTCVTIPESVTEIGEDAFSGTAFYNNESNWENNVLYIDNCLIDVKTELSGEYVIKEDTRLIASSAFEYCWVLTSVTIPESVTSIGGWAFRDCSGLTSVTIPESVTTIGDYVFYGCSGLTSVTIPESVTEIGWGVFADCSGLTSIEVASGNENYIAVDGVLFNKDMTSLIQYPAGKDAVSYNIPESVTSIGDRAFYNCSGLTSVTIPKGVTSIGDCAFSGCSGLTSVTIPKGVTWIGGWAFEGCSGLTSVTIPEGVTSIGHSAFEGCSGLTSVTIPEGVTSIEYRVFYNCSGLTSVTIPESVTWIEDRVFYNCSGLTSITIPESVTEIRSRAFEDCISLTSITSMNVTPPSVFYSFDGVDKSIPVYVPKQSVEAYKSAEYWKDFTNIIGKFLVVTATAENGTVIGAGVYEENEEVTLIATPDEGYTFVKWEDGETNATRKITVTEDVTLTAVFEPNSSVTPISDIQTSDVKVRLIGNRVVVEGADDYTVYSISGQSLGKVTSVERGIYIVVAEGKSYKVAVK